MKLVIIYGPPGVGKLTVAKALAKQTGFHVFHNHLTLDLLTSFMQWEDKHFFQSLDDLRIYIFELAAKIKIGGLIFTMVYNAEADDDFIRRVIRVMKKRKVKTYLIQLVADKPALERRVLNPSRKKYHKVKHVSSLRKFYTMYRMFKRAPFPNTISIDNTRLSPKDVVRKIQRRWKL